MTDDRNKKCLIVIRLPSQFYQTINSCCCEYTWNADYRVLFCSFHSTMLPKSENSFFLARKILHSIR